MLVLKFNLLHRATLRQCVTKAGCRLQFNSVISSFTRLSESALARRARISLLLSPWESGQSTAMWKADCSAVPHAHIGLRQSFLWTLYKKPLRSKAKGTLASTSTIFWRICQFFDDI